MAATKTKKTCKELPFKKGDQVYVIDNRSWGTKPMTVSEIMCDGESVLCVHPDFGTGGFVASALAKVTPERAEQLAQLEQMQKECMDLKAVVCSKLDELCKKYEAVTFSRSK